MPFSTLRRRTVTEPLQPREDQTTTSPVRAHSHAGISPRKSLQSLIGSVRKRHDVPSSRPSTPPPKVDIVENCTYTTERPMRVTPASEAPVCSRRSSSPCPTKPSSMPRVKKLFHDTQHHATTSKPFFETLADAIRAPAALFYKQEKEKDIQRALPSPARSITPNKTVRFDETTVPATPIDIPKPPVILPTMEFGTSPLPNFNSPIPTARPQDTPFLANMMNLRQTRVCEWPKHPHGDYAVQGRPRMDSVLPPYWDAAASQPKKVCDTEKDNMSRLLADFAARSEKPTMTKTEDDIDPGSDADDERDGSLDGSVDSDVVGHPSSFGPILEDLPKLGAVETPCIIHSGPRERLVDPKWIKKPTPEHIRLRFRNPSYFEKDMRLADSMRPPVTMTLDMLLSSSPEDPSLLTVPDNVLEADQADNAPLTNISPLVFTEALSDSESDLSLESSPKGSDIRDSRSDWESTSDKADPELHLKGTEQSLLVDKGIV